MPAVRLLRMTCVVPLATLWQVVSPLGEVRAYHQASVCHVRSSRAPLSVRLLASSRLVGGKAW